MTDFAPRLVVKDQPAPNTAPAVVAEPAQAHAKAIVEKVIEQVIVKEPVPATGWRFVPHRDENNLIVEIIATPIP